MGELHSPGSGIHPSQPHRSCMCAAGAATPAVRWALAVARIPEAPFDPGTLDGWAALLAMSRSTLQNRCRTAGALPRDSLALGRLMRAIRLGDPVQWRPEDVLDITDERTVGSLLRRGGLAPFRHQKRPSLDVLFFRHGFSISPAPLVALARLVGLAPESVDTITAQATARRQRPMREPQ
jgi:AraC-like DNA-binding protein